MTDRFRARAEAAFSTSVRDADTDIDKMLGDHSMMGKLQSGATIKAALQIFEDHTSRALTRTLSEASKLIEHRGRKWHAAMDGITQALDGHLSRAPQHLEKTIKLADRGGSPSVAAAVQLLFEEMQTRLHARISEFRDGWTVSGAGCSPTAPGTGSSPSAPMRGPKSNNGFGNGSDAPNKAAPGNSGSTPGDKDNSDFR